MFCCPSWSASKEAALTESASWGGTEGVSDGTNCRDVPPKHQGADNERPLLGFRYIYTDPNVQPVQTIFMRANINSPLWFVRNSNPNETWKSWPRDQQTDNKNGSLQRKPFTITYGSVESLAHIRWLKLATLTRCESNNQSRSQKQQRTQYHKPTIMSNHHEAFILTCDQNT